MVFDKGWHHGYLGFALWLLGLMANWPIVSIIGFLIMFDELLQILTNNQYGGILHKIYVKTLYKIKFIRRFNEWLDRKFGKDI